ncbi:MAG: hypothetical protein NY202_04910 [Mollicutes bacterium UO1]
MSEQRRCFHSYSTTDIPVIFRIKEKEVKKVYNKKSKYYNHTFYRLSVELENKPELKEILVFQSNEV